MKYILTYLALVIMATPFCAAHAATPAEQIKTALDKGSYIDVQELVSKNPELAGQTEVNILNAAQTKIGGDDKQTSNLMTLAANMSGQVQPDMAGKISDAVRNLVNKIATVKPQNQDQVDALISILNSALTVAKAKPITSQEPELAGWTEAKLETYSDDNDILLAQLPNGGYYPAGVGSRFIPFRLQSTPPPGSSSGSPS